MKKNAKYHFPAFSLIVSHLINFFMVTIITSPESKVISWNCEIAEFEA